PYGWHVYEYVLLTSGTASARRIDEWLPPGLSLLIGKVWVLSLLALVVLLARSPRKPIWREICLLCCFLPLACGSARMIARGRLHALLGWRGPRLGAAPAVRGLHGRGHRDDPGARVGGLSGGRAGAGQLGGSARPGRGGRPAPGLQLPPR